MTVTSTFRGTAVLEPPTTQTTYNVIVLTPNVEVSQPLSDHTKKLQIRCRGTARIQYAFVVTESGTNFISIPRGKTENIDDIDLTGTLYFQLSDADTVEISEWV